MSNGQIRIAIMSDLHAVSGRDVPSGRSHLRSSENEDQPGRQPVGGLLKLIKDNNLTADLLICPGDLGDKADPDGIKYGWNAVNRIGKLLDCEVIGTTGNHDVDSRRLYNKFDPVEVLKELAPPYPFADEASNASYWTRHFCKKQNVSYRLIVVNSSAYHGGTKEEEERGRVAPVTLQKIQSSLDNDETKPLNILVCHHHPQQHSELNLGDYDWMRQGQELLDLLGTGLYGAWIVVHGHKHHPKISYASGGASSPLVFSAGSFSAALYQELGTAARNQFYMLSFELADLPTMGCVGTGQAWDWATSQGWVPASTGSGLPASFGFGCRESSASLSDTIAHEMTTDIAMGWQRLVTRLPQLRYVLPGDLASLKADLRRRHKLEILMNEYNVPYHLGRVS